jgi:hypothetical protein
VLKHHDQALAWLVQRARFLLLLKTRNTMSRDDLHELPSRSEGGESDEACLGRPRVVIFELESGPMVEILELPESATLGDSFCHSGTEWQVMATRTGDRVLIARPVSA